MIRKRQTMKKIVKKSIITLIFIFGMTMNVFAAKKYYAKFMPQDYSNWIWTELKGVTSCKKTADGLQYIIKYRGVAEPRIVIRKKDYVSTNELTKERDLTMTIGVDNILIYEYDD